MKDIKLNLENLPKRTLQRVRLELDVPLAEKLRRFAKARKMSQAAVVEFCIKNFPDPS